MCSFHTSSPSLINSRDAIKFSNNLLNYSSSIGVRFNGRTVNGKSPIGILSLSISKGNDIEIIVTGENEIYDAENIKHFLEGDYND